MSTFSRFIPFLKPYLSRMVLAGVLVMGVAAINLTLLRLAGTLWDIITVQRDQSHSQNEIWREIGATYIAAGQYGDARDALERFWIDAPTIRKDST